MKETASLKIDAHKDICQNNTVENKRRYESMKNKAVSKSMREMAEEALSELQNCPKRGQRKKGRPMEEREAKGRKGGQRKKERPKE